MNEIKISAKRLMRLLNSSDRLEASIDDVTVDVVEEGTKGILDRQEGCNSCCYFKG